MRIIGYIAFASMVGGLMGATAEDRRPAITAASRVPLSFEQATSGDTRWMARGNGYRVSVGAADVRVGLSHEQLRIVFLGADATAVSAGLDALPGKVNYLVGRDPKGWLQDVPTYSRVRYKDVYPGVDVLWYGRQGRLEYDLELRPRADSSRIAMRFEGAQNLALDANGDVRVQMAGGSLSLKLPEVYQEGSGGRMRVRSGYELRDGNEVGFHLADYDKARPLVIDPTLVYATYFGSNNPTVDAMGVDGSGNIYMAGYTNDNFIPVLNAVQAGILGQTNAFVAKFDPTGKTVLYSTYIGGSQVDSLGGIAVDTNGNLVGTGQTTSPDFPLVNAVQLTFGAFESAFAFGLNAAGNALVYSTYLGGYGS
ncbi:MAG: SBBP repeat-containing protein, partial [Bryobacteraceae bacterium]